MGTDVFVGHGIHIRRIALGYDRGPGYEIHARDDGSRLTEAEFRFMLERIAEHLMELAEDEG